MKCIRLEQGQNLREDMLVRQGALPADIVSAAARIVEEVRTKKDEALLAYERQFDHVDLSSLRVPTELVDAAPTEVGEDFLRACTKAEARIRQFHMREVEQSWFTTRPDGTIVGELVTPLDSVGIYVPGGRAQYPSTVLMNAVPAKVAGVKRIVMVTPPQPGGVLSPYTLCAAKLAGVDEIYTVGGAQAIGALAYGTESIPQVSKICGPGNAWVAAAKKIVSGDCGIDMVAGPSEVCVLADASADPDLVAIDLLAQAEHDPMATSYLVTTDDELSRRVLQLIEELIPRSPRADITRQSWENNGTIVVAPDMCAAVAAVNVIAPEHLEIQCVDALHLVGSIRNAGAIFVGRWSSEPLGDYIAGPNHTLPTGGTARFSGPLSVREFVKHSSILCYSRAGLIEDCDDVVSLAEAEGLWAHAQSVLARRRPQTDPSSEKS